MVDLTDYKPYNPLDKKNLGVSVGDALLESEIQGLPPVKKFKGAGLYCIYYRGNFPAYAKLGEANREECKVPIYVGKAVSKGARKGDVVLDERPGWALYSRLVKHSKTIAAATNLSLSDFCCRFLVVEDIWIALGEATLVQHFRPLWNVVVDGFGNNDPGKGRYAQLRSQWDTLHPGRAWALKCQERIDDPEVLARRIFEFPIGDASA